MKILNKYILEITVFSSGAVIMIFELTGSRILGPYFGTSIFIWTSLIGVILGSLSLGYYFGGKIADKNPSLKNLSLILFISAVFIGLTILIKEFLLIYLQNIFTNTKISAILASIILFSPTSLLLGMVSPYAVKLKIKSLETSARTVGNLYAISTIGSIFGTFLSGFYLIPFFGTNKLLIVLLIILFFTSILVSAKELLKMRIIFFLIIILGWQTINYFNYVTFNKAGFLNFIDVDTAYNRIWIYDKVNKKNIRIMGINNENHSTMLLDSNELAIKYTKYYDLGIHFNPDFKKTLMIGGGGYSYPKYFLSKYNKATIDVVEIDPKITELAKKYFLLKDDSRLTIYHEDARVFLNKTNNKYDIVFGDAFGSRYGIPYQLTTKEAVQKIYNILNDDGVIVLNIISAIDGKQGEFLRAEYATYKGIFPQVYIFPVLSLDSSENAQNIMLVALKSKEIPNFNSTNSNLNDYLNNLWKNEIQMDIPILTDDFAPVDNYINKIKW